MKSIRKGQVDKKDEQSNLSAYKKIDKLLKKHELIQNESNQNSERQIIQNLKNLNDGL